MHKLFFIFSSSSLSLINCLFDKVSAAEIQAELPILDILYEFEHLPWTSTSTIMLLGFLNPYFSMSVFSSVLNRSFWLILNLLL